MAMPKHCHLKLNTPHYPLSVEFYQEPYDQGHGTQAAAHKVRLCGDRCAEATKAMQMMAVARARGVCWRVPARTIADGSGVASAATRKCVLCPTGPI